MHPGFMHWWHARRAAQHCGQTAEFGGCGPGGGRGGPWAGGHGHGHGDHGDHEGGVWDGGGAFGVRRPLRFLAFKLDLDDKQVTELARILSDLKTERAQAAVDHRRSTSALADAVQGETFDVASATGAANDRVKSAERLRDAVVKALEKIHVILDAEQRGKLAYLLRTGALMI